MRKIIGVVIFILFILFGVEFKIDASYSIELQNAELINAVIENKLGIGKYQYEYLDSFTEAERYILVEGDNKYLIYDTAFDMYVEYSKQCNSPFNEINKKFNKLYIGPSYYYIGFENQFIDIISNRVLSNNEISSIKKVEFFHKGKMQEKNYNINNKNNIINESSEHLITNSIYFENLINKYPTNSTSRCSYVALSMLLSYYDTTLNDNIISEDYDSVAFVIM